MKRFRNILVVFNSKTDNRALFNQAVELAQRNHTGLTVIDVIEEISSGQYSDASVGQIGVKLQPQFPIIEVLSSETSISVVPDLPNENLRRNTTGTVIDQINIQELITRTEQLKLGQYVDAIKQTGIEVTSKTEVGIPFIKIIQTVLQNEHDLVMVTAEGGSKTKETLFGSTTMHLMRKCPCPVWVIKPGQPRHFNRILAAVDLVKGDRERAALAEKIMQLATSLARSQQSELLVMHTWNLFGESILRGRGGISDEEIEKLLQETRDDHRQWLIELIQQHTLENLKTAVYLLKGDPGALICNLAQVKEVDLIVMGTVSRAGLSGLLIGNTAEKVLQQVKCSMLTVKPEGFVSPVKTAQG